VSERKIAFFDFDGTITTKDTLLEVIKFQKGRIAFYLGFLLETPVLLAYKLKFFPNNRAKERILGYFFGGTPEHIFQSACDEFAEKKLPGMIRPAALAELERLRKMDFDLVVVSASAGNWIRKWADQLQLKLVATKLEIKNGLVTGRIEGKNVHGEQKAICIREQWNLKEYAEIYAYGDSASDKAMLALATKSFYKPFRTV
jgi:phosphatidylglycerophosphatase C